MELGRGRDLRHPARPRRQPAHVPHRPGEAGARHAGRPSSTRPRSQAGKVTAYDSPIYIADAALYLMATKPDLRSRTPTPSTRSSSPPPWTCSRSRRPNVGEYWSDYLKEIQAFKNGSIDRRHHVAGDRQPRPGREGAGRGRCCPRRARPAGPTPGWWARRASTRPVPTSSSTTSSRRRPTPPSRSTSVRPRPTSWPAPRPPTRTTATTFHAEDEDVLLQGALLEHPDLGVPRRSHRREVHRLRRVDQGVVRDPQLG